MPHIRKVRWIKEIDRDNLSTNTKNSLGSSLTVFNLSEDCTKEILSIINEKKTNDKNITLEEDEELELIQEDIISKANEFIKDKIIELSWENMENLVVGIFKAIGYKTKKTPKGPDLGYDIMASLMY
jgi:restriction system protein